jgi:predicted aldo/keto reductase-like oxidoreductase
MKINRRDFLTKSSIGVLGTGILPLSDLNLSQNNFDKAEQSRIKDYRLLGRTGFKVSDIGCGSVQVNTEGLFKAILASGVNFIDTSESLWRNEEELGRVVNKMDRNAVFINTKIMVSGAESADKIIQRMKDFLKRSGLSYLDGMMLWNVNSIKETENKSFLTAFSKLRDAKLVRFSGISCHGSNYVINPKDTMADIISAAVESDRYDLMMFVHNYVQNEMGEKILKVCEQKGVGTLLMKTDPFGGYFLRFIKEVNDSKLKNDSISQDVKIVYDKMIKKQNEAQPFLKKYGYLEDASYKKAALSFVLNNPLVHSALISFKNFDDVNEYVNLSGSRLDNENTALIDSLVRYFGFSYCRHACGKCEKNCPNNVPINTIMRYNHYFMAQAMKEYSIKNYNELPGAKADKCIACEGLCEKACPYNVMIQSLLTIAHCNLTSEVLKNRT